MSILAKSGLAELGNRRVLQVYGRDASKYIQAILTNDMKRMEGPGDALYGAFLAPKGRVLGDCHVIQTTDDTFLLEYDDAINEQMLKHWKRYKIRMKVTLEDKSDELKSVAAFPATLPSDTDANVLDNPSALLQSVKELNSLDGSGSGIAYMDPRGDTFGVRAIVPSGMQVQKPEGYDDMDLQAYTDRRVFLGAGEGHELVDNIPLEVNLELLGGVSFRKGCYVGQELTARTQFKGNVRKRLLPVAMVPSSETDLVDALQDIPFGRIDDASHAPLRDFLANTAAANLTSALGDGVKIVKPDSTKAVGTVRTSGDGIHAALAMVRLQHLLPTEDESRPMRFQTADGGFHAIPYEPAWWPPLDVETGKMLL